MLDPLIYIRGSGLSSWRSYFMILSGLFILGAVLHLLVPPKEKNIKKRGKEKEIFSSTSSYRLVESSV